MTNLQAGLIASGTLLGAMVVGLLLGLIAQYSGKRGWQARALELKRQLDFAERRVDAYQRQRDALADGRKVYRAIGPNDLYAWIAGKDQPSCYESWSASPSQPGQSDSLSES